MERERLRAGIWEIALKWGQGLSRQGAAYGWLIDSRELLLQQDYCELACRWLWRRLRGYRPEVVAGYTLAAHPLALGLKAAAREEGVYLQVNLIRRQPKEDGLQKQVEGPPLRPGQRVVLVDDLINSGETQQLALRALRPSSAKVVGVGVLIDYEKGGAAPLKARGIPVEAAFSLRDLGLKPEPAQALNPTWVFEGLNSGRYSAPKSQACLSREQIWIGSDQGFILSLNRQGRELWRYAVRDQERGVHASPLLRQGCLYVGAYDGFLYCLEARSGKLLWEKRCGDWIGSSAVSDAERIYIGVEFGEMGGSLMALQPDNGSLLWESSVGHYLHSTPCLAPGVVLVAANDGVVRCLDRETGHLKWCYYAGGPIQSSLSCDETRCYVACGDGLLSALEVTTGVLRWQRRLSRRLYCKPLLVGDLVLAGGDSGCLIALYRHNGQVAWVSALGAPLAGGAGLGPDQEIWLGTLEGRIYCLDGGGLSLGQHQGESVARPGNHTDSKHRDSAPVCLGQFEAGCPIRNLPAADLQSVLIADNGGRLYCFARGSRSQSQRS